MRVKTIKYRELFTFDYNNYAVEMEAELEPGEDEGKAMDELKDMVRRELKTEIEFYRSMEVKINELCEKRNHFEQEIRDLMDHVRYQEYISKMYGIPVETDIPF